jgi:malate dehydrogenase (oxaloacetate-decarboxylating)
MANSPGALGRMATAIGRAGGNIVRLEGIEAQGATVEQGLVVNCCGLDHIEQVRTVVARLEGAELLETTDLTFALHQGGKIEVLARLPITGRDDLSMAYTPGVARVCNAIAAEPARVHDLTMKGNTVAIVTDGTAVLGLGDIGPEAALPVMEGKALLFKEFAGVDAFPICLDVHGAEEIVETVARIAPGFGGINLEDIAAPVCFDVEERLRELLDIPVFHDDQHGTAVVTMAALTNALRVVGKQMDQIRVVISGVGAAGVAIAKMMLTAGVPDVVGVDRQGAVHTARADLNRSKRWFAENTNPGARTGSIADVVAGADVFVGVSAPGVLTAKDVSTMASGAIVFAMANPDPEIHPDEAARFAAVVATGRSDFPNQINNVLAFPGIFRGALDARATEITETMKLAAADAIARAVSSDDLGPAHIIPSVFDRRVVDLVAPAVAEAARKEGMVRS